MTLLGSQRAYYPSYWFYIGFKLPYWKRILNIGGTGKLIPNTGWTCKVIPNIIGGTGKDTLHIGRTGKGQR